MRFKCKIMTLLLCISLFHYNEIRTTEAVVSLPGIMIPVQEIIDNPLIALSIVTAIPLIGYITKEYWLTPIFNFVKKQEAAYGKKESQGSKDNGMGDFTKSQARIYKPGEIKTKLKDVAGLEAAKLDVADIMAFLKNPKSFIDMGAKIPKGVLMQGPPGNGKTLLAKAIAGEVACPFISVCASEFIEMFVGAGAARIRDLFAKAKELAPCILFIDEFDAIGKKRSSVSFGGGDEQAQTLGQLLALMDGFDMQKHPIIVLAATNRVEVLDPAVVRPGRFDRIVEVGLPEIKDRAAILHVHLNSVKKSSAINIPLLARATSGFSGAELAHLINEAAILAVNDEATCVEMRHIELAYDHITLGREIKGMERNSEDRWLTAIHEAGHAIGYLYGGSSILAIHKASIVPRSFSLGVIHSLLVHESHKYDEADLKARIVMILCGGISEQAFGFGKSTGPSSDLAKARALAYEMVIRYGMSQDLQYISYDEVDHLLPNDIATQVHRAVQKLIDECVQAAKNLVELHKAEIIQIAELLMEKGTVMGEEIYDLLGLPVPDIEFSFC